MMIKEFDKKNIYENEIEEKILEIKRICNREKMPMFISICVANSKDETEYKNEMLSPIIEGVELKCDQIAKHLSVSLGFDTTPPTPETVINAEDIC